MRNCKNCNEVTSNPKFCSKSCSTSFNNKLKPKRKPEGACKLCGCLISTRYTYCKNCKNKSKNITLKEAIYSKHHRSSAYALVRSRARRIMKNEKQICCKCGYDKHVEVCHKKSICEYDENIKISEINKKENLILLCPNCHWEFDNGLMRM